MKFTFKLDRTDRVYLTDEFVSNGHWAVRRRFINLPVNKSIGSAFKPLVNLPNGSYTLGYAQPRTTDSTPDMHRIIPSRDGYENAELSGKVGIVGNEIRNVELVVDQKSVHIAPRYVALLSLGVPMIKDATSPVLVIGCGEVVAVIMPIRK